jgi:hypothetical protein
MTKVALMGKSEGLFSNNSRPQSMLPGSLRRQKSDKYKTNKETDLLSQLDSLSSEIVRSTSPSTAPLPEENPTNLNPAPNGGPERTPSYLYHQPSSVMSYQSDRNPSFTRAPGQL